jgi:hypothetical protein
LVSKARSSATKQAGVSRASPHLKRAVIEF